ncbi:MAG: serine protease, partial [Bdellovibrionota bacterium]
ETLAFTNDEVSNQAVATAGDYTDLDGYESGTRVMKFDAAWARGLTGRNQIVGMADTGLDSGDAGNIHPDFSGRVTKGLIFGLFSKTWN